MDKHFGKSVLIKIPVQFAGLLNHNKASYSPQFSCAYQVKKALDKKTFLLFENYFQLIAMSCSGASLPGMIGRLT